MPKPVALFATVTLALVGANAMGTFQLIWAFAFTNQLPATPLFNFFFWLWFVTAVAAIWCGLSGGYSLLRDGDISNGALTAFGIMLCLVFKVSGQELGYSVVRLSFNIGIPSFKFGADVVGILYLWWLTTLRRKAERPQRPRAETDSSRGQGTI